MQKRNKWNLPSFSVRSYLDQVLLIVLEWQELKKEPDEVIDLPEKISEEDWIKYIVKRFSDTGKAISVKDAGYLACTVECHPYYVQQLAQICWLRSQAKTDRQIIEESFESLMLQLSLLFQGIVESLTNTQIYFLKALIDKAFPKITRISAYAIARDLKNKSVEELKTFIQNLELNNTVFRSDHASNYLVHKGILNRDKVN